MLLDELFYDAENGWMVTPWGPIGYESEQPAVFEGIAPAVLENLDRECLYACDSRLFSNGEDRDMQIVTGIGEVIGRFEA